MNRFSQTMRTTFFERSEKTISLILRVTDSLDRAVQRGIARKRRTDIYQKRTPSVAIQFSSSIRGTESSELCCQLLTPLSSRVTVPVRRVEIVTIVSRLTTALLFGNSRTTTIFQTEDAAIAKTSGIASWCSGTRSALIPTGGSTRRLPSVQNPISEKVKIYGL